MTNQEQTSSPTPAKPKKRRRRAFFVGALFFLLALGVMVLFKLHESGAFVEVQSQQRACQVVDVPEGPEDVEVDPQGQSAFVSTFNWRPVVETGQLTGQGQLSRLRKVQGQWQVTPQTLRGFEGELRPHGLSLVQDQGKLYLFVINHRGVKDHTVERFVVEDDATLAHLETIRSPRFNSPNDLWAVDQRSFYLTNDHGAQSHGGRSFEDFSGASRASIVYWSKDAGEAVVAQAGLRYANGIVGDRERGELYLAETSARRLTRWSIEAPGRLKRAQTWSLGELGGPDNLILDSARKLWIATHPNMLKYLMHAANPVNPSPIRVLTLETTAQDAQPQLYFEDDGVRISSGSVAAPLLGSLVMGKVLGRGLLICD